MVLSFWLTHKVRPFGDPFGDAKDEQRRRIEGLNTIELWFLGGCCMLVVLGAFCRFTALNHHVVACFYYGILVAVSCGVARPMFKLWTSDDTFSMSGPNFVTDLLDRKGGCKISRIFYELLRKCDK